MDGVTMVALVGEDTDAAMDAATVTPVVEQWEGAIMARQEDTLVAAFTEAVDSTVAAGADIDKWMV
jgi:hypothetical protein